MTKGSEDSTGTQELASTDHRALLKSDRIHHISLGLLATERLLNRRKDEFRLMRPTTDGKFDYCGVRKLRYPRCVETAIRHIPFFVARRIEHYNVPTWRDGLKLNGSAAATFARRPRRNVVDKSPGLIIR